MLRSGHERALSLRWVSVHLRAVHGPLAGPASPLGPQDGPATRRELSDGAQGCDDAQAQSCGRNAGGQELLRGEVEADEAYFGGRRKGKRGRGAAGKVPVFGILERGGRVKVEAVGNVKAQTLLASTLKRVRRGSVVYTDRYQVYDALMFCGYRHLRVDHDRRFSRGKVHINGLEGFWA